VLLGLLFVSLFLVSCTNQAVETLTLDEVRTTIQEPATTDPAPPTQEPAEQEQPEQEVAEMSEPPFSPTDRLNPFATPEPTPQPSFEDGFVPFDQMYYENWEGNLRHITESGFELLYGLELSLRSNDEMSSNGIFHLRIGAGFRQHGNWQGIRFPMSPNQVLVDAAYEHGWDVIAIGGTWERAWRNGVEALRLNAETPLMFDRGEPRQLWGEGELYSINQTGVGFYFFFPNHGMLRGVNAIIPAHDGFWGGLGLTALHDDGMVILFSGENTSLTRFFHGNAEAPLITDIDQLTPEMIEAMSDNKGEDE